MTKLFNKKALFALLAITLLVLPAQSFAANAIGAVVEVITCASAPLKCVSDAFEWITAQIGYIIAAITAQLITFSAYFIQVMIKLSGEILKSPVVTEGFRITLNLANLGFVLAVIFIAFVTIFRLQGYETKKLLRNLIVAAVLINFSFTFAGLIMDAANIFGNFFVSAIVGDSGAENITKSIAGALNIHKLNNTVPEAGALETTLAVAGMYYKTLFSLAFMVLFNSVMVITFFAIAGLMVVRYIAISILLIVMPFAWLCWIFPGLYSHWKTWWNNFLKWNIFLPVLMFFVYVAAFTASQVEIAVKASGIGITSQKVAGDLTTFGATGIVDIAQGLVMVGLLFGGMIIAQKMGVAGASAIMTGSSKVKGWVTGATMGMATGKYAYQAGRYATKEAFPRFAPVKGGAQVMANLLNKPGLRWIPGADNAVSYLNKVASRKGEIENYQKNVASQLTDQQLEERLKGGVDRDPVRMSGLLAEAVKRKKVSAITEGLDEKQAEEKLTLLAARADKTNPGLKKELANLRPDMAPQLLSKPGKPVTTEDHLKTMAPAQILELAPETLKKPEIAVYMNKSGLSAINEKGSQAQIEAVREGLFSTLKDSEAGKAIQKASEELHNVAIKLSEAQKARKTAVLTEDKRKAQTVIDKLQQILDQTKLARKESLRSATVLQQKAFAQLKYIDQQIGNKERAEDEKYTGNPFADKKETKEKEGEKA